MRLAYADPPYFGQCRQYEHFHPNGKCWDDLSTHRELFEALATFDGWVCSLTSTTLADLLPLAPGARIGSWVKPFAAFKANVRIAYTWAPVLFVPGRDSSKDGAPVGRDHLAEPITMQKGLTGAKSKRFCRWVLDLMGYIEGDTVIDFYPGTGVMGRVLEQRSLVLATGRDSR